MTFASFLSKIFGNKSQRDLKEINPYVEKITALYPEFEKLSHDELRGKTQAIRAQIQEYVAEDTAKIKELKAKIEGLDIDKREDVGLK